MEDQKDSGCGQIAGFLLALLTFPIWLPLLFMVLFDIFDVIGARQTWVQIVVILTPVVIAGIVLHFRARRNHPEWFTPLQLTREERIEERRLIFRNMKGRGIVIGVATLAFLMLSTAKPDSYYYIRNLPLFWMIFSIFPVVGIASDFYLLFVLKNAVIREDAEKRQE